MSLSARDFDIDSLGRVTLRRPPTPPPPDPTRCRWPGCELPIATGRGPTGRSCDRYCVRHCCEAEATGHVCPRARNRAGFRTRRDRTHQPNPAPEAVLGQSPAPGARLVLGAAVAHTAPVGAIA